MEKECCENKFTVTDFIDDYASDNNSETKTGEARPSDGTKLRSGKVELLGPVGENPSSDAEAYSGGEDGGESGP